jgi:hypothetical protein
MSEEAALVALDVWWAERQAADEAPAGSDA